MTEWQPIETAPRDGTEFQTWCERSEFNWWEPRCRFSPETEAFEVWDRVDYDQDGWCGALVFYPTHWMPLPSPPKTESASLVGEDA